MRLKSQGTLTNASFFAFPSDEGTIFQEHPAPNQFFAIHYSFGTSLVSLVFCLQHAV